MVIDVTRKGGQRDSVNMASFARPYLENYLSIRNKRYKAEKQDVALFLTEYRGVPNRIDASSIEKWLLSILRISRFVSLPTNYVILWQHVFMMLLSLKF